MKNQETFYRGAAGNLSLLCIVVPIGLAASEKQVIHADVPLGTEITGIRYANEALGANSGIKVELVDVDDNTHTLLDVSGSSADSGVVPLKPIYLDGNSHSDLVLTNDGTGAASGEVVIQLEYRFKGY
ncbi:hypothetical protein JQC92_02330 [Shewanella sp. 202IG2-18]|uniref:hypothetical protein n=1 Tax=Parashewanella hymeniacidonis TaxID=2807618 RepID=UPI001961F846|nr:hypothetical protein [Parashewanella hymeniacidonis]MBM7070878.1 hypothetical protein [Parashewanella hymeniacidonis]